MARRFTHKLLVLNKLKLEFVDKKFTLAPAIQRQMLVIVLAVLHQQWPLPETKFCVHL